jgi:hypothetical protein
MNKSQCVTQHALTLCIRMIRRFTVVLSLSCVFDTFFLTKKCCSRCGCLRLLRFGSCRLLKLRSCSAAQSGRVCSASCHDGSPRAVVARMHRVRRRLFCAVCTILFAHPRNIEHNEGPETQAAASTCCQGDIGICNQRAWSNEYSGTDFPAEVDEQPVAPAAISCAGARERCSTPRP